KGLDAAELIGSEMGKTGEQIREEISSGSLDAEKALDALAAGMKKTYDGASAGLRETFRGAVDHVKAAWRDLGAALATPLVDPSGGGLLVHLLNQGADLMNLLGSLPGPVKTVMGSLVLLGGAAATASGIFLLMAPRIHLTMQAL